MVEAHVSMRDDFAASCVEIDALVEIAMRQEDCFGRGSRAAALEGAP